MHLSSVHLSRDARPKWEIAPKDRETRDEFHSKIDITFPNNTALITFDIRHDRNRNGYSKNNHWKSKAGASEISLSIQTLPSSAVGVLPLIKIRDSCTLIKLSRLTFGAYVQLACNANRWPYGDANRPLHYVWNSVRALHSSPAITFQLARMPVASVE